MSYQDGTNTGADAIGHAQDVARDAKARATSLASEAGNQLGAAANSQKDSIADRLESVSQAVHRSGEQLEGQEDFVAKLVESGADQLGTLANSLRNNDLQGLMNDVGALARRQPALFVGASMAAGFALARVARLAANAPGSAPPSHSGRVVNSGAVHAYGRQPGYVPTPQDRADIANAVGEA
jgi:hypothetical protein